MVKKLTFAFFILFVVIVAVLFFPANLEKSDEPQNTTEVVSSQIKASTPKEEAKDLSPLKEALGKEITAYKGEVALVVTDIKSGKSISINGDKSFYPASAIKILILISVLDDVEEGKYGLESIQDLIFGMMSYSSNERSNKLILQTGLENLKLLPAKIGLESTNFFHGFSNVSENVPRVGPGENSMTANDANLLWEELYSGVILNPTMTKTALGFSKLPNVKLIYAPVGDQVHHKPGYIPSASDETYIDCGVVEGNNFSYVVSYFSKNNPTHQAGADFGLKLTKLIYEWFAKVYGG